MPDTNGQTDIMKEFRFPGKRNFDVYPVSNFRIIFFTLINKARSNLLWRPNVGGFRAITDLGHAEISTQIRIKMMWPIRVTGAVGFTTPH